MRVCIIGGTGVISSCIVDLLLEKGHEVTLFNRGINGPPPEGVRLIQGDRNDRHFFVTTLTQEKFDAAIDMVCFNKEDAESDIRAFGNVEHFIQCSTVCTYGNDYSRLPISEDHPVRPDTPYGIAKNEADSAFMCAYYKTGFPVTIIKPSTTYGPKGGMLRQVALEFTWIDRIRNGKPIIICGDGNALHQFLFAEDAANGFVSILGRSRCTGQIYNMVNREFITWADYHRIAMRVLGQEVELIGIPYVDLANMNIPDFQICKDIFSHHCIYNSDKLYRDVPEFNPAISLETGMRQVIDAMDRENRIPDYTTNKWEDAIIKSKRNYLKKYH